MIVLWCLWRVVGRFGQVRPYHLWIRPAVLAQYVGRLVDDVCAAVDAALCPLAARDGCTCVVCLRVIVGFGCQELGLAVVASLTLRECCFWTPPPSDAFVQTVYAALGAIIFSMYIVYDTQVRPGM